MKARKRVAFVAVGCWLAIALYLVVGFVMGQNTPKVLLDQHPSLSLEEWQSLMQSPLQQLRELLSPIWSYSRYTLSSLAVFAIASTYLWWRWRSNISFNPDAQNQRAG